MTGTENKKNAQEPHPCECSRYSVLVNLRESDGPGSDLEYDEELTTNCTSTTRSKFAPGHDGRLKGALIRWGAEGYDIRRDDGGMVTVADAETLAGEFIFQNMVTAGIERARAKAAARAERAAARAASRSAGSAASADPGTVKAKVKGRTYEGQVEGEEFHYRTRAGQDRRTTKFQLV
ncbi:hypothetical protein ABZ840_10295 [Streptomyces sp. NPDC047117]|uniref:hypothetical protein n=1 Tax=Streptomyces sp. NPDC047117 TaxID=3155379 RepID=UPI0033F55AB7